MGQDADGYFKELGPANNAMGMEMKWTDKKNAKRFTKQEAERVMQKMQKIAEQGGFYAPLRIEPAD
jgi:hypothetical protein